MSKYVYYHKCNGFLWLVSISDGTEEPHVLNVESKVLPNQGNTVQWHKLFIVCYPQAFDFKKPG